MSDRQSFRMVDCHGSRARRTRFTLVEFLVVILIVTLLAAMLLPVLRNARDAALAVSCANNLKQECLLHDQYLDDNRRRGPFLNAPSDPNTHCLEFPAMLWRYAYAADPPTVWGYNWDWAVYSVAIPRAYQKTVFSCPKKTNYPIKQHAYFWQPYCYNAGLLPIPDANLPWCNSYYVQADFNALTSPSVTLLFYERLGDFYNPTNGWRSYSNPGYWSSCLPNHHKGGINTAYCDGHAKGMWGSGLPAGIDADRRFWRGGLR